MPEPLIPANVDQLRAYEAGVGVLAAEGPQIRDVVDVLSWLSSDPADRQLLPLAAEVATEEDMATRAVDVLPGIRDAVRPFTPRQTDPEATNAQRWTMDWDAIRAEIDSRIDAEPELPERLNEWFLDHAPDLIETTYGAGEVEKTYAIIGGANDQAAFRATLALADMASPEFRAEHGLATNETHGLTGEDGREPGWLKDWEFVAQLREHVKERITAGELNPRMLVLASARRKIPDTREKSNGEIVRNTERDIVDKYLNPAVPLLYPDQGLTEADAMLGGALMVFDGDASSIEITDIPRDDPQATPNKLISFDSALGRIHMVATVGEDANLRRQMVIAGTHKPELFQDIDALYGTTTGIYTRQHRPVLREAAGLLGLGDIHVDALGISAHAADIPRKFEALIGELTNYLKVMYGISVRMLENAELNTQLDMQNLAALGGTAMSETSAS